MAIMYIVMKLTRYSRKCGCSGTLKKCLFLVITLIRRCRNTLWICWRGMWIWIVCISVFVL